MYIYIYIIADANYLNIYPHIYGNKLVICQLQNAKSNFQKFCKVYARQNQITNLIYLYIHLVETFALILHSKIVFKKLSWLKLSVLKEYVSCT